MIHMLTGRYRLRMKMQRKKINDHFNQFTMSLPKRFVHYIKDQNLFQKNDQLLLAVSGGIDSVVLTELCYRAGYNFFIAHCNFHLRKEESNRDEQFSRSLAEKYSVPIFVHSFETENYAAENKLSIQVAARELRYNWFKDLANEHSVQGIARVKILTAHHANDNIETLLMNFFKGTGIRGLQGILPKQGDLIRPLLFVTKEEIIQFATENELLFVEDSSNLSDKYTRNYFRNQWIPSVQKIFPQVEENLVNNIERFREIDILYNQAMDIHRAKLLEFKGKEVHIPILKLLKVSPIKTILYEILKDYNFTAHQTEQAVNLLRSESGKYISSQTHRMINNRGWLIIAPINTEEAQHIIIEETDETIVYEEGVLSFKKLQKAPKEIIQQSTSSVILDSAKLVFPVILRKWKQGDYFYPLGMQKKTSGKPGKKKLSKFFIDQKISLFEKETIWVLESNKKIIWIINKRLDERFKVTSQTKSFLSIEFNGSEKYPLG